MKLRFHLSNLSATNLAMHTYTKITIKFQIRKSLISEIPKRKWGIITSHSLGLV